MRGVADSTGDGRPDLLVRYERWNFPGGLLGQKFYLQAFTLDTASFGASNGLELVFGP